MIDPDYLKLLVEETPDALIATAPDGKVMYWNRGAETTFGYTAEEAIGRLLDDQVVPADWSFSGSRSRRSPGRAAGRSVQVRFHSLTSGADDFACNPGVAAALGIACGGGLWRPSSLVASGRSVD